MAENFSDDCLNNVDIMEIRRDVTLLKALAIRRLRRIEKEEERHAKQDQVVLEILEQLRALENGTKSILTLLNMAKNRFDDIEKRE